MTAGGELGAEDRPSLPIQRGQRLGRYVLTHELAAGGMATVYLARASGRGIGKLVALKVIHPHLRKQAEFVQMFLDEARIASRIVHPNVCGVFDYGAEGKNSFLAMEFLVGESAGRLMRAAWKRSEVATRPATVRVFARIIAEACEGLHAAHETRGEDGELLGVVHRDVTPHNLFAGYDGSVRVVDFGVALVTDRSEHTTAGTLKGKFPYMSPEQVRTDPLDRRSDVWSLGVCFWEMLTGRRLFGRDGELATLEAVAKGAVPLPSSVAPHVPRALDAIVKKALERDREKRYATARELGRDLGKVIGALGGSSGADLAELMEELFPGEERARLALMEEARQVEGAPAPASRPDLTMPVPLVTKAADAVPLVAEAAAPFPLATAREPTAPIPLTGPVAAAALPSRLSGSRGRAMREPTAPIPLVTAAKPRARRRHWPLLILVFVVVLAALAGWGLFLTQHVR